jgi:UDP-N-acetylglucosamine 2-epimerase (non-hydrolysing)
MLCRNSWAWWRMRRWSSLTPEASRKRRHILGVPCLTVRTTTERPITLTMGTNRLIGPELISESVAGVLRDRNCRLESPEIPLWDGDAAERATECLRQQLAV